MAFGDQPWKLPGCPWALYSFSVSCPHPTLSQSCDTRLSHDSQTLPRPVSFPGSPALKKAVDGGGLLSIDSLLCSPPTDRGTIHKVVESGDQEHSFVFNIMEIQPFHRAAAIQTISLDADRVSYPTLLCTLGSTQTSGRGEGYTVCSLHALSRTSEVAESLLQSLRPQWRDLA